MGSKRIILRVMKWILNEMDPVENPNGLTETEVQKDGSMEIHEQDTENTDTVKNCIVVTGPIGKFGHGQSEHYDMAHFDDAVDSDCSIENIGATGEDQQMTDLLSLCLCMIIILVLYGGLSSIVSIRSTVLFIIAFVFTFFFYFIRLRPQRFNSKRLIKWTLDEFSEKLKEYVFTSPVVQDKSGSWELAFRQTADEEISFGLVAKHFEHGIKNVVANIQIYIKIAGRNLIPESDPLKFVHKFECNGDCGFSPRIPINYEQLMGHKLEINCRICFTCEKQYRRCNKETDKTIIKEACEFKKTVKDFLYPSGKNLETGMIHPENKFEFNMTGGLCSPIVTRTETEGHIHIFLKHPETKTFVWKIPNFPKRLKTVEFEALSSPQLIVNSNGFCSIWRLQLTELDGVFRLIFQVRGLPRGISQIKIHHLFELVDNFGECIPLKHRRSAWKNPEFLHLWDTRRVPLYPREAILERFVDSVRSLSIRISLHCEPNNTVKIFKESTEDADWILHN